MDSCCKNSNGDAELLQACEAPITDPILMKNVYEPESQTCTLISLDRDDYRASDGTTAYLDYVSTSEFSTRLRCCLDFAIYEENELACDMKTEEYSEYEYDEVEMKCT